MDHNNLFYAWLMGAVWTYQTLCFVVPEWVWVIVALCYGTNLVFWFAWIFLHLIFGGEPERREIVLNLIVPFRIVFK